MYYYFYFTDETEAQMLSDSLNANDWSGLESTPI